MSGTHSSAMAEDRLFPSMQTHKSTTTTLASQPKTDLLTTTDVGVGPGKLPPQPAFEVPSSKRLLQIATAVIYCLLGAGVVFGYAAFKPILIAEGVYHSPECPSTGICADQEIRLNLMFTIAAVATNVCALLVGTVLDQYGPRVSGVIGSVLFALGCLGFAFHTTITAAGIDPFPPAFLLMAIGGPFIFIPSFHLANAFPRHSGLILSCLTGAFDSSSAVFLLYQVAYNRIPGGLGLRTWFLGYLVVPAFILFAQFIIMPSQSYKTAGELSQQAEVEHDLLTHEGAFLPHADVQHHEAVISEIDSLLPEPQPNAAPKVDHSGIKGALYYVPISRQLSSPWFILIALFTILQMTRINYFVATILPQNSFLLHSPELGERVNDFFNLALPLGGLIAIPFIGVVLDNLSTLTVLSLLVSVATIIGSLGLVERSIPAAITGVILFSIYRPFYYTVVSDYCVKVFGVETFGKVYGAVICMAGLFNLGQAGLDRLTLEVFKGDPRPVNLALMGAALIVGLVLVTYVGRQGKAVRKKHLKEEAMRGGDRAVVESLWVSFPQGENRGYGAV